MAIESQNIYKNARKSAGFTQEKASQLLNVSVDSLRDYEQSQRPVPSDVASAMCDVYQAPYLAVQHLRLTSDLGKRVVPEIQLKDLPEAVLGVLAAAYRDFESRVELLTTKGLSKPDRVREIIKSHLGKITKSEIMAKCPDISQITVQRARAELLKSGEVIKLSGGRYTAYVWNRTK